MPRSCLVVSLLLLGAVAGCGEDPGAGTVEDPSLGAPSPVAAPTPQAPMGHLEQPVAERLRPRLEKDGLTLEYVECPRWRGRLPAVLDCKGYVDGVVGEVGVKLSRGAHGGVEFDAWLGGGVVATSRLVERLEDEGYRDVDCGSVPAYPAERGMRIVCSVHGSEASHVLAKVTGRSGSVEIEDY